MAVAERDPIGVRLEAIEDRLEIEDVRGLVADRVDGWREQLVHRDQSEQPLVGRLQREVGVLPVGLFHRVDTVQCHLVVDGRRRPSEADRVAGEDELVDEVGVPPEFVVPDDDEERDVRLTEAAERLMTRVDVVEAGELVVE